MTIICRFSVKADHPKTMNERNAGLTRSVYPYNSEDRFFGPLAEDQFYFVLLRQ
jgi:hypothetical protein